MSSSPEADTSTRSWPNARCSASRSLASSYTWGRTTSVSACETISSTWSGNQPLVAVAMACRSRAICSSSASDSENDSCARARSNTERRVSSPSSMNERLKAKTEDVAMIVLSRSKNAATRPGRRAEGRREPWGTLTPPTIRFGADGGPGRREGVGGVRYARCQPDSRGCEGGVMYVILRLPARANPPIGAQFVPPRTESQRSRGNPPSRGFSTFIYRLGMPVGTVHRAGSPAPAVVGPRRASGASGPPRIPHPPGTLHSAVSGPSPSVGWSHRAGPSWQP